MSRRIQVGGVDPGSKAGGETQRITVTLPARLSEELVRESVDRTTTVSAVVREAIAEYFARRGPEGLPEFVGMAEHPDTLLSERFEDLIAEDFSAPAEPE